MNKILFIGFIAFFGFSSYGDSLSDAINKMYEQVGQLKKEYDALSPSEKSLREKEYKEVMEQYNKIINSEMKNFEELLKNNLN